MRRFKSPGQAQRSLAVHAAVGILFRLVLTSKLQIYHNPAMSIYKRHRFPPEIISYAVWLYHRFNLSHRDIEDVLSERGITVSYEAIRLWCIKFGPKYARRY